jgi:hypothetical protein
MKPQNLFFRKWIGFSLVTLILLAGCGGGGGEGSTSSNTSPEASRSGVISGTATKGPVSGATVTAFSMNTNGTKGAQIGSAQTDGEGNFSISVGNHSGPVMLQMSGGSYMDEATGSNMNMFTGDVMTCAIPAMSGSTINGVQITPLTSMAQSMAQNMSGGMNQTNMTMANNAVGKYFGVSDILTTHPMDPTVNGPGASATQDRRNYGMTIAGMSQYAKTIGMPHSSGMVTAMMNDTTDGNMDGMMRGQSGMSGGMMGSTQVEMGGGMMGGTMMRADTGTVGLADSTSQFLNSPMNRSGLTVQDMQNLISKLTTSNGVIQ